MTFSEFNFNPSLLEGLESSGYQTATPVQEQVIPHILAGKDIIASAQTGTGKTAAFLLPLINKLITEKHDSHISAIIIVPTRELAVQISQHMEGLSYFTDVSSIAIYGGGDGGAFVQEKQALSKGVDVVICTPGKMIAHLNMGYVNLQHLRYLVLDEADRMLDMGFHDDIMKIINHLPKHRQTLLFSATMPAKIKQLAQKILHNPLEVSIAISKPNEKINQAAYVLYDSQKVPLVKYLLKDNNNFNSIIIFCSKKNNVKILTQELRRAKLNVAEIHSDLEQNVREDTLQKFKSKQIRIVVATDVLSRGIDVEDIDLVLNFDVPNDGEDYIHRIGRTARAAASGTAFTFINEQEQYKFQEIEKLLGNEVAKIALPIELGVTPNYKIAIKKPTTSFKKFRNKK